MSAVLDPGALWESWHLHQDLRGVKDSPLGPGELVDCNFEPLCSTKVPALHAGGRTSLFYAKVTCSVCCAWLQWKEVSLATAHVFCLQSLQIRFVQLYQLFCDCSPLCTADVARRPGYVKMPPEVSVILTWEFVFVFCFQ